MEKAGIHPLQEKDTLLVSDELREAVDRLVSGLKPARIYLFGSQARHQAGPDSDFDLLVVLPESDLPRHKRETRSYDLLWGLTIPIDLVVLTQEEFQSASQVKTSLASTVQNQGILIHG